MEQHIEDVIKKIVLDSDGVLTNNEKARISTIRQEHGGSLPSELESGFRRLLIAMESTRTANAKEKYDLIMGIEHLINQMYIGVTSA